MSKKVESQNGGNPNRARTIPTEREKILRLIGLVTTRHVAQRYVEWLDRMAEAACNIMDIAPGTQDWRVSAILVSIVKSEEKLSYWGLVKHFDEHPQRPKSI